MRSLWDQAFRPLFLGAAVFTAMAMLLWGLVLNAAVEFKPYGDVMFWHQHEMIFGFVAAAIVGFLLTAAQNWTGLRAPHGSQLLMLTLLWFLGRVIIAMGAAWPVWLVAGIDLSFLVYAAGLLAWIVIRAGNMRNLFFVPVLLILTLLNGVMHLGVWNQMSSLVTYSSNAAIFLITVLMVVISGRVLPMFTANGLQRPRVASVPWLERCALVSTWAVAVIHLLNVSARLPALVMSLLFGFAAVVTAWRLLRLRGWQARRLPLLWSLHLAAAFIPVGYALFALRYAGFGIPHSSALHALTAGAMGCMILAMMARVALGHTGRSLHPHPIMALAFALITGTALLRIFYPWVFPQWGLLVLNAAAAGWIIAFSLYTLVYWRILMHPRIDQNDN
ncbi:NnrS family protein [Aliidiomarina sedimenti]|uniref:NnrS family protein n=1 Tax=Aliidiomarina sedimenti TaxID=1933879 RepID=A0ABY0C0L7_9GAMM|nr:NnrS family protein [Aliidiomarina sedimenti]RUO30684.1 NnrS family protein [Aliidiomarina sedimenti]